MRGLWAARRFGGAALDQAAQYARAIEAYPYSADSPLFGVAAGLREHLRRDASSSASGTFLKAASYLEELEKRLTSAAADDSKAKSAAPATPDATVDKANLQLRFKLFHTAQYFKSMHSYMQDPDIAAHAASRMHLERLVDTSLLGTASERLAEHISLLGSQYSEESLALCLHTYCESEVATAVHILQSFGAHKKCQKRVAKLAKVYLVDHLELNVKNRCVYAWSATELGKDGLAPDTQPMQTLLYGRKQFFPENEQVCRRFIEEVGKGERVLDEERQEWKDSARKGALFLLCTSLLDWLVCSL